MPRIDLKFAIPDYTDIKVYKKITPRYYLFFENNTPGCDKTNYFQRCSTIINEKELGIHFINQFNKNLIVYPGESYFETLEFMFQQSKNSLEIIN